MLITLYEVPGEHISFQQGEAERANAVVGGARAPRPGDHTVNAADQLSRAPHTRNSGLTVEARLAIGPQPISRPFGDETAIALGRAFQTATNHHRFMAATAQAQAEATKAAQRAGIEHAKAKDGATDLGRKPSCSRKQFVMVKQMLAQNGWYRADRPGDGTDAADDLSHQG
jgi:hypothetical protein